MSAPTAREVVDRLLADLGAPRREPTVDSFLAGDPDGPVTGVAVTMMATFEVLTRAVALGLDLVVTHEPLYYDHHGSADATLAAEGDPVLRAKSAYVERHGLRVWHLHDALHDLTPDLVDVATARALGWSAYPVRDGVFTLPPTTLGELARHVAASLRADALRYVGPPSLRVRTVGLDLGFRGFARNRRLLRRADVAVVGEAHEWETGAYAADLAAAGVPGGLVVVGHVPSEQEAMVDVAARLRAVLPRTPVAFVRAQDPYRTLSTSDDPVGRRPAGQ